MKVFIIMIFFLFSCTKTPKKSETHLTKKEYYTKKYSTLLVTDLIIGYTCKNVLHFGIPICIVLDAAGDASVIAYQTTQYQKKTEEEKAKNNGVSTAEPLEYNYKEFLLDVGIFALMLVIL